MRSFAETRAMIGLHLLTGITFSPDYFRPEGLLDWQSTQCRLFSQTNKQKMSIDLVWAMAILIGLRVHFS